MYWLASEDYINSIYSGKTADLSGVDLSLSVKRKPIYTKLSGTGTVSIKGPMLMGRDWLLDFFGARYCTYPEIVEAISVLDADPETKKIFLDINSGGGHYSGVFDVVAAMQKASTKIEANISGMCASAAYLLASQASSISSRSESDIIGSIGTAATYYISDYSKPVTNRGSERKRPDVSTDEGLSMAKDELDDMQSLFFEAVAVGRSVSVDHVKKGYGQGATMIARTALSKGMIDSIISNLNKPNRKKNKEKSMDIETLKSDHAALYNQAVEDGEAKERERVIAHITLMESSGATETAIKAIKDGSGLTPTIQAEHIAASINGSKVSARSDESTPSLDGSFTTVQTETEAQKLENETVNMFRL